jgi:hypothetical protein
MARLLAQLRGQVIGIVALCVALSGTAYAALALPPNSVGGGVVKNNSLTGKDVKNGSLTKSDLKKGTLKGGSGGSNGSNGSRGPKGEKGDQGDPGTPGTARAYGSVGSDGVKYGPSLNLGATSHPGTGLYCFATTNGLTPTNAVGLVDTDYTPIGTADGESAQIRSGGTGCPAGSFAVRTYTAAGALNDAAFAVIVP